MMDLGACQKKTKIVRQFSKLWNQNFGPNFWPKKIENFKNKKYSNFLFANMNLMQKTDFEKVS